VAAVAIVIVLLSFVRRAGGVGGKIYLQQPQTVNSLIDASVARSCPRLTFMASLLPELTAFFYLKPIQAKAKSEHDAAGWSRLGSRSDRSVAFCLKTALVHLHLYIFYRVSFVLSLLIIGRNKGKAMLKRRKLKGVRCAET